MSAPPTRVPELPPEAYAAVLAGLPGIGPARLVELLRLSPPQEVWGRVLTGEITRPPPHPARPAVGSRRSWAEVAARIDVGRRWGALQAAGIGTAYLGGPGFPDALVSDPEPPGVLFWLGDLGVLDRPCVAIIGTRQCTSYGRSVATELGHDLALCGVSVISGLALGIDGAAHLGSLAGTDGAAGAGRAGPVGVAASGVDRPYPARHAELWGRVAAAGGVISETPPGQPAQAWRFPARNRLIAGVSRAVVVVESHASGGSMLTVAAAADRGIDVLVVPGPVTSPASAGTNQLLHEGLGPVRHAGDVLAALGDLRPWPPAATAGPAPRKTGRRSADGRPAPLSLGGDEVAPPGSLRRLEPAERRVLDAIDRTPTATSVIADRTGLPIGPLGVVLMHLEARGLVRGEGPWWERSPKP
jgi:DNA processing protein